MNAQPKAPTPVEDVEMETEPSTPVRREEPSGRRRPPEDFDYEDRRRRGRYMDERYGARNERDREMEKMERNLKKAQTYGRRQKLKKSTLKRQSLVMAKALGTSESNVRLLSNYVKRFSQQRM